MIFFSRLYWRGVQTTDGRKQVLSKDHEVDDGYIGLLIRTGRKFADLLKLPESEGCWERTGKHT
jgi:hypothetical protein